MPDRNPPDYSEEELDRAIEATDQAVVRVAQLWGEWYGRQYGIQRSDAYWQRILTGFLTCFVPSVFDALRQEEADQEPLTESGLTAAYGLIDYNSLLRESHAYRSALHQDAWTLRSGGDIAIQYARTGQMPPQAQGWKERLDDGFGFFKPEVVLHLTPTIRKDRLKLMLKSRFRIASRAFPEWQDVQPDLSARKEAFDALRVGSASEEALVHIVLCLLPKYLPLLLFEGFREHQPGIHAEVQTSHPRRIVTGYGFYTHVAFSVWAAECGELGSEIWGWQHGGNYGECVPNYSERGERRITDRFISWGWHDGEEDIVPLPAPRQFLKPSTSRQTNGRILWVTTGDSKYTFYLDHLIFGPRFEQYFQHQQSLYEALPVEMRKSIDVRLYPRDFDWGLKQRWEAVDEAISFAPLSEPLQQQMQRYELVVIDHFGGTTMLECLMLDQPFVMCGQSRFFRVRHSAQLLFEKMRDIGIFHQETGSLRSLLERHFRAIGDWWLAPDRKQAVAQYRNYLLKPSGDHLSEWSRQMLASS